MARRRKKAIEPAERVHVFACSGRFTSFKQMRAFIDPTYTEDGEAVPSGFMREVGLTDFEPMCIEAIHDRKRLPLGKLLEGVSYGEQWLSELVTEDRANAAICVYPPNQLARPEGCSLTYYGSFEFRQ